MTVYTLAETLNSGNDAGGNDIIGVNNFTLSGIAQYDSSACVIPAFTSMSSSVFPSFEIISIQVKGNDSTTNKTITLNQNITNTTNYAVFPIVYYGFSGSSGTYNALGTSGAINGQVGISDITKNDFKMILQTDTGDNKNIYIVFLVVYQMAGMDYSKSYTS